MTVVTRLPEQAGQQPLYRIPPHNLDAEQELLEGEGARPERREVQRRAHARPFPALMYRTSLSAVSNGIIRTP